MGALAWLLNWCPDPDKTLGPFTAAVADSRRALGRKWGVPDRIGQILLRAFDSGGWHGVQMPLVLMHLPRAVASGQREAVALVNQAFAEALVFEGTSFTIKWCEHGQHHYVCADRRQKDCPPHNKIGEMSRWRRTHPDWRRGRQQRVAHVAEAEKIQIKKVHVRVHKGGQTPA